MYANAWVIQGLLEFTGYRRIVHRGATIHEHFHPSEEVYEVIEGELEIAIDGAVCTARPGVVAIVPANARHSVRALTAGKLIVVDQPARREFG